MTTINERDAQEKVARWGEDRPIVAVWMPETRRVSDAVTRPDQGPIEVTLSGKIAHRCG